MSRKANIAVLCLVVASLATTTRRAAADEVEAVSPTTTKSKKAPSEPANDEESLQEERRLNGHLFVPFTIVLWPFVDTSIASTTNAGFGWFSVPEEDVRLVDPDGKVAVAIQTFILRLAFTRWLGFEARVGAGLLVGNDRTANLLVGANAGVDADGRLMFRFSRTDWLQLSGSLDGGVVGTQRIVPRRLIDSAQIVDGVPTFNTNIKSKGWRAYGGTSLTAAIGVASWFGLQMSAAGAVKRVDPDTSVDGDEEVEGSAEGTLGLSFDTGPIMILAGAGVTHDFRGEDDPDEISAKTAFAATRGIGEVGLHLQVPEALDVGLTLLGSYGENDRRLSANFRLGYFW